MYVKKFNETSPIASSASHEMTIIKADMIRTIIIDYAQKAMASVVMQIAHAINQLVNHRAAAHDVIMRLLEKITHDPFSRRTSLVMGKIVMSTLCSIQSQLSSRLLVQ